MNNEIELKRFSNKESAEKVISFLQEKNFEYYIEEKNGSNSGMTTDILENQIIIWVSRFDYHSIMSQEKIKEILLNEAPEHYLYTFSDKAILTTIKSSGEYTNEEIELAIKIASERGLNTSEISEEKLEVSSSKFPPKPIEEIKSNSIIKSIFSLILFIGVFYLVFKWDFTFILILAGAILIHELGHFLAMRIFKYNNLGIFFIPLVGAFASGTKNTVSQKQNVIVLLAGPLPGVLIGIILYYFGLKEANEFLIRTSNIFIIINLFNLLPIMPLDGGKIIKSMFFENNEIINTIFLLLSIATLTYISVTTHSYFLLIVPFFLLSQISAQSQDKKVRKAIQAKSIDINKPYDQLTNEEYWMIRDEIGSHVKYFSRFITPMDHIESDKEQKIIAHVKLIINQTPIKDLKIGGKIIITLLWLFSFIIPLIIITLFLIKLGYFEKL